MDILTQDRLKKLLDYDPELGIFTRKVARKKSLIGKVSGYKNPDGYLRIKIGAKTYLAHRLAWLFVYGKFPDNDIDHIDHNSVNNRISNLRDVSHTENMQNQVSAHANGSTGLLGVSYRKDRNTYKAIISLNGKQKVLGHFKTAPEAHAAYVSAKRVIHSACMI